MKHIRLIRHSENRIWKTNTDLQKGSQILILIWTKSTSSFKFQEKCFHHDIPNSLISKIAIFLKYSCILYS